MNPYEEVFKRSKDVIHITLIISLIVLTLGVLLMVLVSRNYYLPVKKMVQAIASHMDKRCRERFTGMSSAISGNRSTICSTKTRSSRQNSADRSSSCATMCW